MSQPKHEQRPFFHLGNLFRVKSPKSSQLPVGFHCMLNAFEETLSGRLRKLMPKGQDDVLSLSWMTLAIASISDIHKDVKTLITNLEFTASDWDDKCIDVYLDISVKLLDVCNAFSSELSRLKQGSILLQCILLKLEGKSMEKFVQARCSIDKWRLHIGSKNPRVGACSMILRTLPNSLYIPKVKNSSKGKVLIRAMYGVKFVTVYICSMLYTVFAGSPENLLDLVVSDPLPWAQAFLDLQATVNVGIRATLANGNFTVVKELSAANSCVKTLYPMIQDVDIVQGQALSNLVLNLGRDAEKLSQGVDSLIKEVDGFFKIVLAGRDALIGNLRVGGAY